MQKVFVLFPYPTCLNKLLPIHKITHRKVISGALISVPAVRSFCLMSSLSIVLQLFFLCVLFLPICIMDIRREQVLHPFFGNLFMLSPAQQNLFPSYFSAHAYVTCVRFAPHALISLTRAYAPSGCLD